MDFWKIFSNLDVLKVKYFNVNDTYHVEKLLLRNFVCLSTDEDTIEICGIKKRNY